MPRSWRQWLLAGATAVLLAATLVSLLELRGDFRRDSMDVRGTVLFAATSVDREYWLLADSLNRYSLGEETITHEALMLRLDVFSSQLSNYQEGAIGRRLSEAEGAVEMVALATSTVEEIRPEVQALAKGDAATGGSIMERLSVLADPVHEVAQAVDKTENEFIVGVFNDTESTLDTLTLLVGLMAAAGVALLAVAMFEARRANRNADAAEQAGREVSDLNEHLEQRIRERTTELEEEVAERRRVETELSSAEERFRQIFERAQGGNVVIDGRGNIESVNSSIEAMFGYSADELQGQRATVLVSEPDRAALSEDLAALGSVRDVSPDPLDGDEHHLGVAREITGVRKSGETIPMLLGLGAVDAGGERSYIASIGDLTETKLLEAQVSQAQRSKAIGELTGGVAHDFNNLLSVMLMNTELLFQSELAQDPEAREDLMEIRRAVERGASLTSRLLSFARQQTLKPVPTMVADQIEQMGDLLRRSLGEDIEVVISVADDTWPVMMDAHQFDNALLNLALNARDAMPDGGTLTIETENVTLDDSAPDGGAPPGYGDENGLRGDFVRTSVSDTGRGIEPADLARVFEPFFTTKEVGEGSGLGLSMVYGFARQSDGRLTIQSEPGAGTTVSIYLPRSDVETEGAAGADVTPEVATSSSKVLVVEDDDAVRRVVASVLTSNDFEVIEAGDGNEGMRRLEQDDSIDLLFTDVVLPGGMSGIDLARWAKRRAPNLRIVLTSGYPLASLSVDIQRREFTVLSKPTSNADVLAAVRAALR